MNRAALLDSIEIHEEFKAHPYRLLVLFGVVAANSIGHPL